MKTKQTPILLLLLTLFFGCSESELDQYPSTKITEGNFYQTEGQLIQAVNDVYRQLERSYQAGGLVDLYAELYSDNTYIEFTGGSTTYEEDIVNFRIQPNNGRIQTAWEASYNSIFIANSVIEHLETTSIAFSSPALRDRLRAEALFVRSLIYFNMVRVWGDIPFPLEVVSPDDSYNYLRESQVNIYNQLIVDLKEAKSNLPGTYSGNDIGRITKFAASAVLAKVYLTLGDQANAAIELKEIIDSGLFSLDSNNDGTIDAQDYKYIFQPNTKNSKESILELQYLAGQNAVNSNHQQFYTPYHWSFHLPNSTENFRGNGMNTPTQDLINEFEEEDVVRKEISVYPGYLNLETGQFVDYPFTQKFYDPNWRYPGQNVEIIRYADILLLYAEATNNPVYLNQVRARIGLPSYGSPGYPSQYNTLEKAIEHERRIELCFEFHRFFDLVRTGKAVETLKAKGYNITANKLLFPIPQHAIDINPKLTQNAY